MRHRVKARVGLFVFAACATAASACGGGGSPLAPTSPVLTTESFSGTLSPGAGLPGTTTAYPFHVFTVGAAGPVNVTLVSAGPPSTITIGVGVGAPASDTCVVQAGNGFAIQAGVTLSGSASAGSLCVALFDVGNLLSSDIEYTVSVSHP